MAASISGGLFNHLQTEVVDLEGMAMQAVINWQKLNPDSQVSRHGGARFVPEIRLWKEDTPAVDPRHRGRIVVSERDLPEKTQTVFYDAFNECSNIVVARYDGDETALKNATVSLKFHRERIKRLITSLEFPPEILHMFDAAISIAQSPCKVNSMTALEAVEKAFGTEL